MEREDIWDSKNAFRNEVSRIIIQENMKTSTMTELIKNVVEKTKELINREKQLIIIDECWRIYSKKVAKMNSLVSPS